MTACLKFLLSRVVNIWTENLPGIFVPWQRRIIPNLSRNWLVSPKLTWGIWRILIQELENLKNLHFNELLLIKVYNVNLKKYRGFMFSSTEYWCSIYGKLTCPFKNDMRNLANFHQSMFKSLKIGILMGSFYSKWKTYELNIYREVLCYDN